LDDFWAETDITLRRSTLLAICGVSAAMSFLDDLPLLEPDPLLFSLAVAAPSVVEEADYQNNDADINPEEDTLPLLDALLDDPFVSPSTPRDQKEKDIDGVARGLFPVVQLVQSNESRCWRKFSVFSCSLHSS
jgi:hypothetical protein